MSLFWRIFVLNAIVLTAATALLIVAPVTVSADPVVTEIAVLVAGLAVMLGANALLLRVGLAPLARLSRAMRTIDLLRPEPRPIPDGHEGIADLIRAFNTMIDRLETERATSAARALSAQEEERHRVAQELHDEIGQTLTAVLLELKQLGRDAPAPLREGVARAQEMTRGSLDEIRRIARRLRPGVLDELGLVAALRSLATEVTEPADLEASVQLDVDLPPLGHDAELVIYRVAQEALTNVVRHARADWAHLGLRVEDGAVVLTVRDDGRGLRGAAEGAGIRGMRERALLVGAELEVRPARTGGTVVELRVRP